MTRIVSPEEARARLREVCRKVGGGRAYARLLGIKEANISAMVTGKRRLNVLVLRDLGMFRKEVLVSMEKAPPR